MFGFKTPSRTYSLPPPSSPRSRARRASYSLTMFNLPRRSIFIVLCGLFLFILLTISHQLQLTTAQFRSYSNWIQTHGGDVTDGLEVESSNLVLENVDETAAAPQAQPSSTTSGTNLKDEDTYIKQQPPVSYDRSTPPEVGCAAIMDQNRKKLLWDYSKELRGYSQVNLYGSSGGDGPGKEEDAFIWTSQQLLLQHLGIQIAETCETTSDDCTFTRPKPRSWASTENTTPETPSSTPKSVSSDLPILISSPSSPSLSPSKTPTSPLLNLLALPAFSTSSIPKIHTFPLPHRHFDPIRTQETINAYNNHPSVHVFTSDPISHKFLTSTFPSSSGLQTALIPDIGYIWGDRSDLRLRFNRRHDVLILGSGDSLPPSEWTHKLYYHGLRMGHGELDLNLGIQPGNGTDDYNPNAEYIEGDKWHLNPTFQKLSYWWGNWENLDPYEGNSYLHSVHSEKMGTEELGKLAWAKTMKAMEHLASARVIITDRLHVHIMASVMGIPHILLDRSTEGVVLDHDVWTRECRCTRVVGSMDEAWAMLKFFLVENGGTINYLVGEGRLGKDMVEER